MSLNAITVAASAFMSSCMEKRVNSAFFQIGNRFMIRHSWLVIGKWKMAKNLRLDGGKNACYALQK